MSRSCFWDRYWGRAGPYKQSQKPLRKLTRPSLFLFPKVANSVTFFFPFNSRKKYIIQIQNKRTFTSTALDLVSSRVWTSSTLSNMLPWEVASSRRRVSSRSFRSRLLSLQHRFHIIYINLLSFDIKLHILCKSSSKFNFVISPLKTLWINTYTETRQTKWRFQRKFTKITFL